MVFTYAQYKKTMTIIKKSWAFFHCLLNFSVLFSNTLCIPRFGVFLISSISVFDFNNLINWLGSRQFKCFHKKICHNSEPARTVSGHCNCTDCMDVIFPRHKWKYPIATHTITVLVPLLSCYSIVYIQFFFCFPKSTSGDATCGSLCPVRTSLSTSLPLFYGRLIVGCIF